MKKWPLLVGIAGALATLLAWQLLVLRVMRVPAADLAGVPRCMHAQPAARHAKQIDAARRQLAAMMRARRIPGLSVAVAQGGVVIWAEGFGYADLETRRPVCPVTRFRIGSVSKPLTSAAMARLYDAGRLDLDAPLQRYVPSFPDQGAVITARQLASHRAGIRHYRDDLEAFSTRHYDHVVQSLEPFRDDPLLFTPGTDHEYSSYGYVLLSAAIEDAAIEDAAGEDFVTYFEREVAGALGLAHTSVERAGVAVPELARFYDHVTPYVSDGSVQPAPFTDPSYRWASGGMLSTPADLVRFGSAMLPQSAAPFLERSTRELLFEPLSRPQPPFGYALGWMTMRDLALRRVVMHFGAGSGGTAFLGLYPESGVVVVFGLSFPGFWPVAVLGAKEVTVVRGRAHSGE